MKRMKWGMLVIGILSLLIVMGCGNPYRKEPSAEQWANADYGPRPINYENLIKTYLKQTLFDYY